ncbi:MAG: hypothetical protein ABI556_15370 [Gemmatimonadales bacterium]
MRRRLSLALLTLVTVLAIVIVASYVSRRNTPAARTASSGVARDSTAAADSAVEEASRQNQDTMCFASRIGLPCDPH